MSTTEEVLQGLYHSLHKDYKEQIKVILEFEKTEDNSETPLPHAKKLLSGIGKSERK